MDWSRIMPILVLCLVDAHSVVAQEALPTVVQDYNFHCAACHGASGQGGGPVARALKIEPPDLTRMSQRHGGIVPKKLILETILGANMPDAHGTREMPVWGDLFVGETLDDTVSVEDAQEAVSEATERARRLAKYLLSLQVSK